MSPVQCLTQRRDVCKAEAKDGPLGLKSLSTRVAGGAWPHAVTLIFSTLGYVELGMARLTKPKMENTISKLVQSTEKHLSLGGPRLVRAGLGGSCSLPPPPPPSHSDTAPLDSRGQTQGSRTLWCGPPCWMPEADRDTQVGGGATAGNVHCS